jgi:hypothetical protein
MDPLHDADAVDRPTARANGRYARFSLGARNERGCVRPPGRQSFVVTTGTGSGKSLCFFLPIVDAASFVVLAEALGCEMY